MRRTILILAMLTITSASVHNQHLSRPGYLMGEAWWATHATRTQAWHGYYVYPSPSDTDYDWASQVCFVTDKKTGESVYREHPSSMPCSEVSKYGIDKPFLNRYGLHDLIFGGWDWGHKFWNQTRPKACRCANGPNHLHAHAQQQGPKPIAEVKPAPVPEVELVPAAAESSAEIRNALQNEEAARLAYENAQTRTANTLLRALGEASIKPHECERPTPQGVNPFGCWKVDRQGVSSFEKPKAKK